MALIFLFPGQSSRYPGMLEKLAGLHPAARAVVDHASAAVGRDLVAHNRGENAYTCNLDVQLAVFVANHMFMAILHEAGIQAQLSLGLSLGEYNHLVHIGALAFDDALKLVQARGRAYDSGPRGWMASVQPLSYDELHDVVSRVRSKGGDVEIVNLNSPRQNVIAGTEQAVKQAMAILEDECYINPVVIEKQVPMHASMFAPVSQSYRLALSGARFTPPRRPYLPNRLGKVLGDPTRAQFVDLLATHVAAPVLWRQSIDHVVELSPDAVFVEVGAKQVLCNLMRRKWHKNRQFATDSREDTRTHIQSVVSELRALINRPALPHGGAGGDAACTRS